MKINIFSLLDSYFYNGGGEVEWQELIDTGIKRGIQIKQSFVFPHEKIDAFDSPDITCLVNLFNHGKSLRPFWARKFFSNSIINNIVDNENYFHFDNGYCDVCDAGYLPCNGKNEEDKCNYKSLIKNTLDGGNCFCRQTRKIYKNAKTNFFLSPLHFSKITQLLGDSIIKDYCIIKPYVDTSKFFNMNLIRDIKYIFLGVLSNAKGLENMGKLEFRDEIVLIGKSTSGLKPKFGKWLGPIPYSQVPLYLNRAENFVFLPSWPEPKGRVVIEAILCGCKLITNENIGAFTIDMDLKNPYNYMHSRDEFWKNIEEKIFSPNHLIIH